MSNLTGIATVCMGYVRSKNCCGEDDDDDDDDDGCVVGIGDNDWACYAGMLDVEDFGKSYMVGWDGGGG